MQSRTPRYQEITRGPTDRMNRNPRTGNRVLPRTVERENTPEIHSQRISRRASIPCLKQRENQSRRLSLAFSRSQFFPFLSLQWEFAFLLSIIRFRSKTGQKGNNVPSASSASWLLRDAYASLCLDSRVAVAISCSLTRWKLLPRVCFLFASISLVLAAVSLSVAHTLGFLRSSKSKYLENIVRSEISLVDVSLISLTSRLALRVFER